MCRVRIHFILKKIVCSLISAMMGGKFGDKMTLWERFLNTLTYRAFDSLLEEIADLFQVLVDRYFEKSANVRVSIFLNIEYSFGSKDMMANSSLVFFNSDPLADFPKLTSARIIDIGGISVHAGYKSVDKVRFFKLLLYSFLKQNELSFSVLVIRSQPSISNNSTILRYLCQGTSHACSVQKLGYASTSNISECDFHSQV